MPELPDRPAPPVALAERARRWLLWVGVSRVIAGGVAVVAVLAAAYWLVKPPAATTESRLPFAVRTTVHSSSTTVVPIAPAAAPPSTSPSEVVVDVAGAVAHVGVYRLRSGSRVIDAVTAAGGMVGGSNGDAVNLAALLIDGQRIYVPRVGEPVPVIALPTGSSVPAGPVNLNTATADELDRLPGVGPATAAAIIAHRQQYGPYMSVDELAKVRGIGAAKVAALRGLVVV